MQVYKYTDKSEMDKFVCVIIHCFLGRVLHETLCSMREEGRERTAQKMDLMDGGSSVGRFGVAFGNSLCG